MLSSNSYPKSAEFTCVYTWGDFRLILQSITRDSLKNCCQQTLLLPSLPERTICRTEIVEFNSRFWLKLKVREKE